MINKLQIEFSIKEDFNTIKNKVTSYFNVSDDHFEKYVPILYQDGINTYDKHVVAKVEDEIVGVLAFYNKTIIIKNKHYNFLGIGSICVDPSFRKLGIMTKMWEFVFKHFDNQIDFYVLSGDYTRYINYGFHPQPLPIVYKYGVSDNNTFQFEFARDIDEQLLLDFHNTKENKVLRDGVCLASMKMWGIVPVLIKHNDDLFGYLLYDGRYGVVEEVVINDYKSINDVMSSFTNLIKRETGLKVSILNEDLKEFIQPNIEWIECPERTLYKILNPEIKNIYVPRNDLI